jgi:uncharacterized coiled-coil protein SlyX
MTKEDLSITYENNIFYCTKNNTKWISVDGEKWYVEEKRIAELEKENAELKGLKDVATLIKANNDTVITLMQLNNMLVSKNQQLTKAKDHIKKLLDCLKQDTNDPQTNYYVCQYMDKAEQFLKDTEEVRI